MNATKSIAKEATGCQCPQWQWWMGLPEKMYNSVCVVEKEQAKPKTYIEDDLVFGLVLQC